MNPFLPLNTYIPDGEPKVFGDRVYLYGSKDLFGGEYCCYKFHVYSALVDNLEDWTDHGPVLASRNDYVDEGIEDTIPWSDGLLWAPDVVECDGKYYMYFCQSDGSEGVAVSDYPHGPFLNPKRITMAGENIKGIDPSVLKVGDDYYYTWGQGNCHIAKLNKDMCSLDETTYAEALISRGEGCEGFHEASSLRKIGDWFCIVYASEYVEDYPNRGGHPTKLDYATSKNIYGPYERKGTIINNYGIDPASWNNHGSIVKIKDDWFVFYHGSSNNCKYTRRARIEKIEVDEAQGLIKEAVMTTSGVADSVKLPIRLSPTYAYCVEGGAYFTERGDIFPLVNVKNGTAISYRYLDFSAKKEWNITLEGKVFCDTKVTVTADGEKMCELEFLVGSDNASGSFELLNKHCDIKITFDGECDKELLEINEVSFM
ncbi:MAG: family 43 glycosylhydrolase [Lachnospiraceae bacterium]|nr:family 43 glycosylhydrolase [Lachnospiraceae bacterium]